MTGQCMPVYGVGRASGWFAEPLEHPVTRPPSSTPATPQDTTTRATYDMRSTLEPVTYSECAVGRAGVHSPLPGDSFQATGGFYHPLRVGIFGE